MPVMGSKVMTKSSVPKMGNSISGGGGLADRTPEKLTGSPYLLNAACMWLCAHGS